MAEQGAHDVSTSNSDNAHQPNETTNPNDQVLTEFMSELKSIEKRDSVLTGAKQIERLTKQGSSYFNLNPYEVLQVPSDAKLEEIKKVYRRLSIIIHPDKNMDNREKAQLAFEALNKAYKQLQDEEMLGQCHRVISDAKSLCEDELKKRRKLAKKQGRDVIDEDDPVKYEQYLRATTLKMFADLERRRRELEMREMNEKKRQRVQEIDEEEKSKKQKELDSEWESHRGERVSDWRDFQKTGGKTKKKGLKPPKLKVEKRV